MYRAISLFLVACTLLVMTSGCQSSMQDVLVDAVKQANEKIKEQGIEAESPPPNDATKLVSLESQPSPGRTNPFEIAGVYANDESKIDPGNGARREVRVLGFIEVDQPMVVLSIDGRSHTLKIGETFDKVTVLEAQPPRARLSYDGVTWYASIFDPR